MIVLGIETSCDETAAAVLDGGRRILSNIVASQDDVHGPYGGIVPELASRRHIDVIVPVIRRALETAGVALPDIDGIAVTQGPGLVGSLLIGCSVAKAIAYAQKKPLVGVNHLEGHIYAAFLEEHPPAYPFVALVVSGGHTALYAVRRPRPLRAHRPDARRRGRRGVRQGGEAAGTRLSGRARHRPRRGLGRSAGHPLPHGPHERRRSRLLLQRHQDGRLAARAARRPAPSGGRSPTWPRRSRPPWSKMLVRKTVRAALRLGIRRIVLTGGVAANSRAEGLAPARVRRARVHPARAVAAALHGQRGDDRGGRHRSARGRRARAAHDERQPDLAWPECRHLLRGARPHAQRTGSTPRVRPSGAALQLDLSSL